MTDEKYTFVTDVAEKKRTARGAFNKKTHNGKGGRVKFPSDYLSKKERESMNDCISAINEIFVPTIREEYKILEVIKQEILTETEKETDNDN